MTEEITRLECDKEILEFANTQLIEEKRQLETSVMLVQAENNQLMNQHLTENNQLKSENDQLKTENNQLKTENNQLRSQIAAERIQSESHHKEEKLHLESHHQREKQLLQPEVERLTKELDRINTGSISKNSIVSMVFFKYMYVDLIQSELKLPHNCQPFVCDNYLLSRVHSHYIII